MSQLERKGQTLMGEYHAKVRMTEDRSLVDTVWTIPNVVSYVRFMVLLPLTVGLIASDLFGWALVTMALLGMTDWLDGFLARRLDQTSKLGQELDPVADRGSVLLVTLGLVLAGLLPWYMFAAIVVVDVTLVVVATMWFGGYPDSHVTIVGKARTTLLLVGLPLLMLAAHLQMPVLEVVALIVLWLGIVGHWLAGIEYVEQMVATRKHRRRSSLSSRLQ